MNKIKITVVTVVYNGADIIENTIANLINQTYDNIEYIIVDGGSKDGTQDIIRKYEEKISLWKSEPDKGIYDAMNKAIQLATGDYIYFLNVGDNFYSNKTLENIITQSQYEDVIYGNTCIKDLNSERIAKAYPLNLDWKTMPYCHQSVLIKRTFLINNLFDLSYKIAADYNQYHELKKSKAVFKFVDETISIYDNSGFSSQNAKQMLNEYIDISVKNSPGFLKKIKVRLYFFLRMKLRKI
ncbi:glycosyltransferase involved in cell wall biosynthesis [Flavobacterium sp. 2755]|uniref:glycosyltransferase family 2 protein n=1 Tax=Flavobacterium sp. 2755 TaxID=2817765 RepID=UPI0028661ABE|nr:glycosyltransferase family 2 protein [Flavobacterium sp. 2755]MDR6762508.1 glycosyltransferase involved in cell wall biosynthesis [Flavobacterium sp. 2755]